jgi:hypothetical protein
MPNSTRRESTSVDEPAVFTPSGPSYLDLFAKWLSKSLGLEHKLSSKNVKTIFWYFSLLMVYVFIQHKFDQNIRKVKKAENKLQEARANYIFYKSKYLDASKQSSMSVKLSKKGFDENSVPPLKIAAY